MTQMIDADLLDMIHDELANYMDDLSEVYKDYSGRYMYGQTCVGWVHNSGSIRFGAALFQAIVSVAKDNPDSSDELLSMAHNENWYGITNFIGGAREDSMGLGTITYFPNLRVKA